MAKSKEERNISALDYLFKKLYWLGNKIEALSRGKINKKDLLIYSFIVIFIVSVYFGGILGGFTFVLVLVTLWNARITQGLLKRSEETFEQSRITFLIDIIDRTIAHLESIPQNEVGKQAAYIVGKAETINRVNRKIGLEFLKVMKNWDMARYKVELEKRMKNPYGKTKGQEDQ